MSNFPIPEWATSVEDAQFTDPAQVQTRAAKFERTIKRRNFIEYAAGAFCIISFGGLAYGSLQMTEYLIAGAYALCIACVVFVLWQLRARGSHRPLRPEESCLDHLRDQYLRQYNALRTVPQWYLGPLTLGVITVYTTMIIKFSQMGGLAKALEGIWQPLLGTAAFFGFVWWLNWFAAQKLKRQIDQIDTLG